MDHLADFEQDKLKKLIRQFPDVAFPDNWCEDDNGWTLYVGRVPLDVTGSELEGVFEKFGRLSNLRIGKSWENAPKQFGFVSYKTAEGASRAISEIGSDTFRLREDQAPLDIKFAQRLSSNQNERAPLRNGNGAIRRADARRRSHSEDADGFCPERLSRRWQKPSAFFRNIRHSDRLSEHPDPLSYSP
eukprot:jgi/Bigna1/135076/aug1.28_g9784